MSLNGDSAPDHFGHRGRLRQRFLKAGADGLHDYELLELLLAHAVQRRDVKPAAKALLRRFGSLAGVLDATPPELAAVAGVGPAMAALIRLAKELTVRYRYDSLAGADALSSPRAVLDFARARLAGQPYEAFLAIFLSAKNRVLGCQVIHEGTVDHAVVYPRKIVEEALKHRAAGLILVHNHPSGDPEPSDEDRRLTKTVADATRAVDIRVLDHIVIGREGYVSFAERRLL